MVSGGELPMDGKNVQLNKGCSGQKGPVEIRSIPARGLRMAGGHEVPAAEGHYRCPHCRPAEAVDKRVTTTRMR
jgi:hypothetical protein